MGRKTAEIDEKEGAEKGREARARRATIGVVSNREEGGWRTWLGGGRRGRSGERGKGKGGWNDGTEEESGEYKS